MTAPLPRDEAVREHVRTGLGDTLFVDAGAGTGKTTALVDRIVNLIATGTTTVDHLAAITFTEAAATDLRRRVRERLEDRQRVGDPDGRVGAALAAIDEAAFTTLHAFAFRLLREHPLDAGLPPELELLSEVDETTEFELRWQRFLDERFDDPGFAEVAGRMQRLGYSLNAIREVADKLHQDLDRVDDLSPPPAALPVPDLGPLRSAIAEVRAVRRRCLDDHDNLAQQIDRRTLPWASAFEAAADPDARLSLVLQRPKRPAKGSGRKQAWPDCKDEMHAALDGFEAALDDVVADQAEALTIVVSAHLADFVRRWAAARRRAGRLVFADLLVLARDLLRGRAHVRDAVRRQFTHVLVDEFQDTDPIQYELAELIGCAPAGEHAIDPGRLFFVGDPKQSIYSFRRADIAIYERARGRGDVTAVDLTENFRSDPAVVAWVNAAFGRLIRPVPQSQPDYAALAPHRAPGADAGVSWFGHAVDGRAADARLAEAEATAAVARTLIDREGHDPSDIAVLVRRHGTVRLLERSLADVDVPYRIVSRSLLYNTDEVRGLLAVLKAVADPEDEVAVVAALRHPGLGCSDRDLVDHAAAGGAWHPSAEPTDALGPDHRVAAGLARLRDLDADRLHRPLGAFVDHVVDTLRLREIAFAHRRPRDRWRRLQFVADQARAFHDAGGHLRSFVRWIEREAAEGVRVDEHVVEEADDSSVRITTVHGAKGLEYPVVVLLGNDAEITRPPGHPRVLWSPDGGPPAVRLTAGLETRDFRAARQQAYARHEHEETRLLYVGATRARERLVVSRWHKAGADCHASRLGALDAEGVLEGLWREFPAADDGGATTDRGGLVTAPEDDGAVPGLAAYRQQRERLLAPAGLPTAIAATRAATLLTTAGEPTGERSPAPEPAIQDPAELSPVGADAGVAAPHPVRRGRAGTAIGRAVHAVLQVVDLAADPDGAAVRDLASTQAAAEGIPGERDTVARLAGNALRSPSVREAAGAEHVWRELHIGVPIETDDGRTIALEGFIDLLYRASDGYVVVDHKTDQLGDRRADQVAQRYRGQAATYALALERYLGEAVSRCVFVFTDGPVEASLAGPDLEAACRDVALTVRAGV